MYRHSFDSALDRLWSSRKKMKIEGLSKRGISYSFPIFLFKKEGPFRPFLFSKIQPVYIRIQPMSLFTFNHRREFGREIMIRTDFEYLVLVFETQEIEQNDAFIDFQFKRSFVTTQKQFTLLVRFKVMGRPG